MPQGLAMPETAWARVCRNGFVGFCAASVAEVSANSVRVVKVGILQDVKQSGTDEQITSAPSCSFFFFLFVCLCFPLAR